MRFNIDKKFKIIRIGKKKIGMGVEELKKQKFIDEYHAWLKQERLKDKSKIKNKSVSLATYYLRQGVCPYCKKKYKVTKEKELSHRICKRHGILGIKKESWNIWKKRKTEMNK